MNTKIKNAVLQEAIKRDLTIDIVKQVSELIGKPYKSNNMMQYGFGYWVTETITSCKPFKNDPTLADVRLNVKGTDGKIHEYCTTINTKKLGYILQNLLYHEFAGKKVTVNGETFYSQEYYSFDGMEYGYVYKNEQAFYENPDEVCYIPEYEFNDAYWIDVNGERYYVVNGYTRKDLEKLVKDKVDEDDEPINVEYFFQRLNWAYPETYLNEMT